jgi:hypothetical protein
LRADRLTALLVFVRNVTGAEAVHGGDANAAAANWYLFGEHCFSVVTWRLAGGLMLLRIAARNRRPSKENDLSGERMIFLGYAAI